MRAVIYTAYMQGEAASLYEPREDDLVLCADGGYVHAKRAGVIPAWIIGDCDSIDVKELPPDKLLRVPKEKDDTDTMLCIRHALDWGANEALLLGGIGGRLDHTLANIQSLAFAHKHGLRAKMTDERDSVYLMEKETRSFSERADTALSLFSYTECCEGVFISGAKYPLENATLTQAFPLGVSNAFMEETAIISVKKGILLVILSRL